MRRSCYSLCAGIGVLLAAHYLLNAAAPPPGPMSLEELAARAEERGLYWGGEGAIGLTGTRLIISTLPLAADYADVRVNNPYHPCWDRTIMVDLRLGAMIGNYEPGRAVAWNGMWVAGDPELIESFTGIRPQP